MARTDLVGKLPQHTAHRLFVESSLALEQRVQLDDAQSNYLLNVLRLREGSSVLVFNGRDGEFSARLVLATRKIAHLVPERLTRLQTAPSQLSYLFAPLKHARLDYMVQKAVEMGAGTLAPVITQRTQVTRLNLERLRANAIEAAEQCELLDLPQILPERPLRQVLETWDPAQLLVFCDEDAPVTDPVAALQRVANQRAAGQSAPGISVLIGPEGGFSPAERESLQELPNIVRLSLGHRILRADTAAVAALALVQAVLGDLGRQ